MFGAPFSGGFICNGLDSTSSSDYDLDLCSRWIQLSTFSPLFLIKTQANDDNIFLGDDLLDVFEATLKLRNSFVPYIYTIIMNSTRNCSIIRPLFYSFINDTNLFNYSNITNNQFTVGDAILVTPILQPNVTRAYVYFPSANW